MIKLTDSLYFHNFNAGSPSLAQFWSNVNDQYNEGGQFYIDIGKRFRDNRFVSRNGDWSLPWSQSLIPGFEMPIYDPTFNKTFEQVSDQRAVEMKALIHQGQRLAVMYSGGMDSTSIMVALLRNLTQDELESVVVCASVHSILENPVFWKNHINGKFKVIDSATNHYDDIILMGYRPITGDAGDCIFGTSIGLEMYHNFSYYVSKMRPALQNKLWNLRFKISDPEIHFSEYKEMIMYYLAYDTTPAGLNFGRLLYEKYAHNIRTASVPILSLHDFFWWLIFNVKYLNCSVRGPIFFNTEYPVKQCIDLIENWFNGGEFQQWSMANNNNGEKIRNTLATYKYAMRKYIHDFDKNDWYFYFKTKLESLGNISTSQVPAIVGIDTNYNLLDGFDPTVIEYFRHHLTNYTIDWTDN